MLQVVLADEIEAARAEIARLRETFRVDLEKAQARLTELVALRSELTPDLLAIHARIKAARLDEDT